MAVIHISEAEAAKDFAELIAKVRGGAEVVIEDGLTPVARLVAPLSVAREYIRPISESLRIARERGSTALLDGSFARDVEDGIAGHQEPIQDPWE
jgi:antitoxin (DNA-binding transcriptional repressor) of toxin-antitoxin stability system